MRRGYRRVAWSFGDQALSSITNVALTIVVARSVTAAQFGIFVLLMSGYLLVLFVVRGMTSDPLVSLHSGSDRRSLVHSARGSAGASILGGLAAAVVFLGTAVAIPEEWAVLGVLAGMLPGVFLQDHLRYLNFALGEPWRAFLIDGIWALAEVAALGVVLTTDANNLALLLMAWGASGMIAAVAGLVMMRVRPHLGGARSWLRSTQSLWRYYAVENLLLQATNLIVLAGVAIIAGTAATGALRGAVTMYSPLALFAAGAVAAGVPEMARLGRRRPHRLVQLSLCVGAFLGAVAAVWTAVVLALPPSAGRQILGDTWDEAAVVLLFIGLDQVAVLFVFGPFMGLRAMGRRQGMATRGWLSLVRVAASLLGAWLDGARGAAAAFAILSPAQVLFWSTVLVRSGTTPKRGSMTESTFEIAGAVADKEDTDERSPREGKC